MSRSPRPTTSKAFSDRWDKVTVATKFGVRRGANGEWLGISGRPEYVKEACEKSLKRLGLETIDLYYQHRPDPNLPVEESVGAMKKLVEEGKVRFIGLSEFSAEQIRAAHAVHPITALQIEYSLWTRNVEEFGRPRLPLRNRELPRPLLQRLETTSKVVDVPGVLAHRRAQRPNQPNRSLRPWNSSLMRTSASMTSRCPFASSCCPFSRLTIAVA